MAENSRSKVVPLIVGAIIGAVGISIIGLSLDWVVPQGTAEVEAERAAERAVLAALTPICVAKFKQLPEEERTAHLAALEDESSNYFRSGYVEEQGWATFAGATDANDHVADACADELMKLSDA